MLGAVVLIWILKLLWLCGDVQRNPGPIKFPCSICFKPVRSNQKAMLCDCCNLWCHCKCSSVSMSEYAVFQSMGEVSWICNGCYVRVMPFAECSTLGSTKSVRPRSRVSSLSTSSRSADCPRGARRLYRSNGHKVVLINASSLLSCHAEVCQLFHRAGTTLMGVAETWLDETVPDGEVCPAGVSIVRNDRNRRGGGVALLLSDAIKFVPRPDVCIGNIETVWIELFPRSKRSMIICCAYRPPSFSIIDFFDNLLCECDRAQADKHHNLLIIGDLNCDSSQ